MDDLIYKFDQSTGVLYISGSGTSVDSVSVNRAIGRYSESAENTTLHSVDFRRATNIKTIAERAFIRCTNLENIILPESIISINDLAFYKCINLTGNLFLPDSLINIGEAAFAYCSKLTGELVFPKNLLFIGNNAFRFCSGFSGALIIPKNIEKIDYWTFKGCTGFTSLDFSNCTKLFSIEDWAFRDCSSISGKLDLPSSLTFIGESAFRDCSNLDGDLVLPANITTLGIKSFWGCINIKTVDLTNCLSLQSIDDLAFRDCTNLNLVLLPKNLNNIGNWSFHGCTSLAKVICLCLECPNMTYGSFSECWNLDLVFVPNASKGFETKRWWAKKVEYGLTKKKETIKTKPDKLHVGNLEEFWETPLCFWSLKELPGYTYSIKKKAWWKSKNKS